SVAAGLVGAAAEERDAPGLRVGADGRQVRLRLRTRQALPVSPAVLGPTDATGAERAHQGQDPTEPLEPDADVTLANAPRPEAHDENARAVGLGLRLVDSLDRDHLPIDSSDCLNFSHGSASSVFGVNHT